MDMPKNVPKSESEYLKYVKARFANKMMYWCKFHKRMHHPNTASYLTCLERYGISWWTKN